MSTANRLVTSEELLARGDLGRCELIFGQVVRMSPSGFAHGNAAANVAALLKEWNRGRKAGVVLGAETGFVLARNPDLVRAPDAAFVDGKRVGVELPAGFFEGAPDLAVEVVSPSDTWPEVLEKVEMWLAHGCRSCWVVDPRNRQVTIHRQDGSVAKRKEGQELEDEVVAGFKVLVERVFER